MGIGTHRLNGGGSKLRAKVFNRCVSPLSLNDSLANCLGSFLLEHIKGRGSYLRLSVQLVTLSFPKPDTSINQLLFLLQ